MKKIVPFKKDITLDNNIAEINSISLEHTLEKQEDNVVSGSFIVSGTYKMNQTSVNIDSFEYKLPVNITIDKKYNIDDVTVDINDFYYEIINGKILEVSIEVAIDNLEEKEVLMKKEEKVEIEKPKEEDVDEDKKIKEKRAENEEESKDIKETKREEKPAKSLERQDRESDNTEDVSEEVRSIFSNMDDSDNYVVYKIHIVTETDTIESIMEEYQTNREKLEKYNDLSDVKIGDKIIIADAD